MLALGLTTDSFTATLFPLLLCERKLWKQPGNVSLITPKLAYGEYR